MNYSALIFVLFGLFSLISAGLDWDWFMTHRRARFISWALGGRERARIFYYLFGIGFIFFGVFGFFGYIDLS